MVHGVLAAEAAVGRAADPALQLAALQCLAAALSTPSAVASGMTQPLAQQLAEQLDVSQNAHSATDSAPQLPATSQQTPAAASRLAASAGKLDGSQPKPQRRSDAASWRAPPAHGTILGPAAAGSGSAAAEAAPAQCPASLAALLLAVAAGKPSSYHTMS